MSDYAVEISQHSRVIILQGTLKKAPQLNKRGRKVSNNTNSFLYYYYYYYYSLHEEMEG